MIEMILAFLKELFTLIGMLFYHLIYLPPGG